MLSYSALLSNCFWRCLFFVLVGVELVDRSFLSLTGSLLVGYYSLHPVFLYVGFVLTAGSYCAYTCNITSWKISFYILTFAFILGGAWSWGNSNWGFFWVNDAIEWALLTLIFLTLARYHILNDIHNNNLKILLSLLILFFVFFRLGFFVSRHSFFTPAIKNIIWFFCLGLKSSLFLLCGVGSFLQTIFFIHLNIFLATSINLFNIFSLRYQRYKHLLCVAVLGCWLLSIALNWSNFLVTKIHLYTYIYRINKLYLSANAIYSNIKYRNFTTLDFGTFWYKYDMSIHVLTSYSTGWHIFTLFF